MILRRLASASFLVLAVLAAHGCARLRPEPGVPAPEVREVRVEFDFGEAPLEWVGGLPVSEARINGRGPYKMVVDTGASMILLEEGLVRRLRLKPVAGAAGWVVTDGTGTSSTLVAYTVGRLELGGIEVRNMPAITAPDGAIFERSGRRVAGVVPGFFPGATAWFDYAAGRFVINEEPLAADGADNLPMLPHPMPIIPLRIGDRDHPFLIDTGYTGGIQVTRELAGQMGLDAPHASGTGYSTSGPNTQHAQVFEGTIGLGPYRIEKPLIAWNAGGPGVSIIGMEILRHFRLGLDMRNRVARLELMPEPAGQ